MKMPGDKHQKKVKAKLHIARIKEIHGYTMYIDINAGFPLFRNHKIPGFFQDFSRNLMPFSRYIFALAANLQLQF